MRLYITVLHQHAPSAASWKEGPAYAVSPNARGFMLNTVSSEKMMR
jgi:hypothetical protein